MDPILAATRGVVLDDELESLAASQDPLAAQLADTLRRKITDRVNAIHPVAIKI